MQAYLFGSSGNQLYGAYHEPSGSGEHGVILAYPGPQEYMQLHYAFRMLAAQLARDGYPVLRFDWRGTGDSAGSTEDVTLQQFCEDLQMASQELLDVSGARRISVVGFRLGATIAASTTFKKPLEQLVLWEPVIRGCEYFAELRARERRKLGDLLNPPSWWRFGQTGNLLGHAISSFHKTEIESLNLPQNVLANTRRATVITRSITAHHNDLADALRNRGTATELEEFDDERAHFRDDGMMLAGSVIAHITAKLKTP